MKTFDWRCSLTADLQTNAPQGTRATLLFVVVSVVHILLHGGIVVVEVLGPFSTSKFNDTDQTWMR